MEISVSSVVAATKSQVSCEVDAETVILHFDQGMYFGLNDVGTVVWQQLQEPRRVGDICQAVLQQYDVSSDQCERDVLTLLNELRDQGLIEVRNEAAG